MSEKKLVQLLFVTLLAYGMVSFIQHGIFLVPLPIFELVIMGFAFYFGYLNYRSNKTQCALFLMYGLLQFLSREYNYAFFLSDEQLYELSYTALPDLILLLSAICVIPLFVIQNKICFPRSWMAYILAIGLGLSLTLALSYLVLIPLAIISLYFLQKNILFENQRSFWLILLILSLSRELTLFLL